MAEKGVLDCDKVGDEDTIELTSSLVKRSYDSTEMKIIEKINEQYLQQINEVERLEGDLEDPSSEIKAVKLKNKILKEWNQKFQQTIRHLCEEMTEAESILGEKYEMLMKHVENMEKLPQMVEKEQKEILKEINAIKAISSDENIGDTKNVSNLNGTTEDLLKKIEELIEQKEHLQEENQKLSKVINSIKEGDSLLSSRTERLEQENEELKARIAELESLSKRSSLSLLDKIEFNNVNTADSGVADELYTETLSAQSAVDLYSSTSSTLKDFPINQNEEYWTLFLKKLESSLKIDIQEYLSANINSVEKLWKILESRIDKCERVEKVEAEVQVDIKNQLSSSVQNLSEIENNVVIMLETIDKHNTGLPLEDIRLLLSEFDEFLTTIQKSIASKITTKIMKNGDVETTGFVDIPESKFKELLDKFKSHEKSINQKITQKNAADMHQFRKQIVSLCVQIEHLRDQIQDKNYYQNENKVLLKKIDTLEKKIQTLNGTITKTFNSLASSDLLEDKKRTELQQAFKMSEMIGITLAIQSIGVAMRNEIFAASVQSEKSREEVRMLTKKIEAKEKEKDDIIKNTEHTRVEMDEMKRAMNTLKMTEEESRQMKKYLQSIKVELIHLVSKIKSIL
uniref:CSON009914 protein n=1 Tax=Culicoides sonorensis TaxID=179676 RepID=A0A336N0G9_CULSO